MKKYAIIVAGGSGLRMGSALPKQFLLLDGKPVILHTLNAFLDAFADIWIILVLPELFMTKGNIVVKLSSDPTRIKIVAGGSTRFNSVQNGLKQINEDCVIFVHDGVRCLITSSLIQQCYKAALENGTAVPAVKSTDSVRLMTDIGNHILDRNKVYLIQTPQTFLSSILKPAFEQPYNELYTDEASVVEHAGIEINLIDGDTNNIKITRPIDLLVAEEILRTCTKDSIKQ